MCVRRSKNVINVVYVVLKCCSHLQKDDWFVYTTMFNTRHGGVNNFRYICVLEE